MRSAASDPSPANPGKSPAMSISHDLKGLQREHPFFIGFDSDGCIFDSMEIKHKECFCPAYIKHFDLQVVAKYAREC